MNYTEHEFNGKTNHLSLTAGALYTIYERFGYTDSIISTLQLDEQTLQGWHNCCWLYALLAAQGELQRRALGYEARPMISMEALQKLASPADVPGIKNALFTAIRQGFTRCVEPTEEEEVDLVLREIELDEKKKGGWRRERVALLACAFRLFHLSPAEALLLGPGDLSDLLALSSPDPEREEAPWA